MNRDQFKKCIGQTLRLQPPAIGLQGETRDDDWTVQPNPVEDEATLTNVTRGGSVVVGFDHVHSYMTDRARGKTFGFLQMHSQVRIAGIGTITAVPLSPRQTGPVTATFGPLVVNDGATDRLLTWRDRDPVHLLPEAEPRQLFGTYTVICDALRRASGREPQFDRLDDIRHDIVWELSPDHRAKNKLLGGSGGGPASGVLVLTGDAANFSPTYSGKQVTARIRGRAAAKRLAELRDYAIDFLQNKTVASAREQDDLDKERQAWMNEVLEIMQRGECDPSDVSSFRRLGTYRPRGLTPLVDASSVDHASEAKALRVRNAKHREEMVERLDRLMDAIKRLEQRKLGDGR